MNAWLAALPTTNLRILVTILLIAATGVVCLVRWAAPPVEWLSFLLLSAGLDVAQFHSKRLTQFTPAGGKTSTEVST